MEYLYRQEICRHCGAELTHKRTGREKVFCSAKCRVYYKRKMVKWARQCVDATLAGHRQPAKDFGYPVQMARFWIHSDGSVTKRT